MDITKSVTSPIPNIVWIMSNSHLAYNAIKHDKENKIALGRRYQEDYGHSLKISRICAIPINTVPQNTDSVFWALC